MLTQCFGRKHKGRLERWKSVTIKVYQNGSNLSLILLWRSLVAQMVKNLPVVQETQIQPLGQEDPLEKGMATPSSILAWRILWTEDPGGLQVYRITKSQTQLSN